MNDEVQKEKNEGVLEQSVTDEKSTEHVEKENSSEQAETTDNPTVEETDEGTHDKTAEDRAKGMTEEQFEAYNTALRLVSKAATAGLTDQRYNAFEDGEIKRIVKQQVMQDEFPNVQELAAGVVERLSKKAEKADASTEENKEQVTAAAKENDNEVLYLKAENALLKAGIRAERIEAAKKLFVAEGADFDKVADFVNKYPEWSAQEGRVVFSRTEPLADRTAPNPVGQPVLNDFEKRVHEIRKNAGLE